MVNEGTIYKNGAELKKIKKGMAKDTWVSNSLKLFLFLSLKRKGYHVTKNQQEVKVGERVFSVGAATQSLPACSLEGRTQEDKCLSLSSLLLISCFSLVKPMRSQKARESS